MSHPERLLPIPEDFRDRVAREIEAEAQRERDLRERQAGER